MKLQERLRERARRIGESPLEHAKRIYQPLVSIDELCGFERLNPTDTGA